MNLSDKPLLAKKERTRHQILDSAITILAHDNGASLAEIAAACGVGRTTLHRYFPTRKDLIQALALMALEETRNSVAHITPGELSPEQELRLILDGMIPVADRFHFLSLERHNSQQSDIIIEAEKWQHTALTGLIQRLKTSGFIHPGIPDEWALLTIDSLTWAMWRGINQGSIAARESARLVYKTIEAGLGWEDGE